LEFDAKVFGGFMQSLVNLDYVTKSPNSPCLKAFLAWILKAMALGNLEEVSPATSL